MNLLFFFYNGPYTGFTYREMPATTAADLNLRYIASNSDFSCNVMTFLCFLRALPASPVALYMGLMVLVIQGLRYFTKHDGKYARTARAHVPAR